MNWQAIEWGAMLPELIVLGTSLLLILLDLFLRKTVSRRPLGFLALLGVAGAFSALVLQLHEPSIQLFHDMYRVDGFSKTFKMLLLIGTFLVLCLAYDAKLGREENVRGEFYYLILTALVGAMFMASSADMITLFIGLELLSVSSYIMAGLKKHDAQSTEAAFKYVVSGGIATAITLFGMSYLFGLSGETNLYSMAKALQETALPDQSYMLVFAFFITFTGLAFKIASVPFHMWAPDVYEGAMVPVTAFLSVVSKTAGFIFIIRFFVLVFMMSKGVNSDSLLQQVQPYIIWLSGITMLVGSIIALRQSNVKRLFAYSSIAQAGFILAAFSVFTPALFETMWFYLFAYVLMNIGAFAVIQEVTTRNNDTGMTSFEGLGKQSPWLALAMTIFLLSLAGIPATVGFIGKFGILIALLGYGGLHYVLAGILIAATLLSYVYYFNLIVQMYFRTGEVKEKRRSQKGLLIVTIVCAAATVIFGIVPNIALHFFYEQFSISTFLQL
ncbi:NADH:ubiquinone oxidoreductase subunit N [Fictibacillus macauensis ZFHKF-1]|uniref:NADH-quinone oxidoreductase subunit N n=1 Tax=Fictibacillus macauensis ZFHKF-1 TaxID=1196324 RepID=I8IWB6_9BACL|nr:NADH-quinone oxidoreductase subunit NuoN [Fictibacillus macauensis]EIT83781.1 NADH:ubiquinone oxidoreductase subunit N [Fictibacillus macauensis ZFHKF-1]